MSKESFLLIENEFRLPESMMKALFYEGGSFSKHYTYLPSQKAVDSIGTSSPPPFPPPTYRFSDSQN
jgi:hypothetical protein